MTITVTVEELRDFQTRMQGWWITFITESATHEIRPNESEPVLIIKKSAITAYEKSHPKPKLIPDL